MKPIGRSLYARISIVYLLLVLVVGVVLMVVTARSYLRFTEEADQKLNRTLAQNLAEEFSPFLQDSLDVVGIEQTMHYLMVMNPRVEIYLLDEGGSVLAYFADPNKVKQDHVNLAPIREFLDGDGSRPILGDDPRKAGQTKPFSVAPVQINSATSGYLYVILGGEGYDSALGMVQDSHIARITFIGVAVLLVCTWVVGMVMFLVLTRRFTAMTEAVRQFERGAYDRRIPGPFDDEIGQLAAAFNQMADTVVESMEEVRRNDELRRELVANVSHDLRSPLASIQGYIETILMKDGALADEERSRYLHIILDNTTRLSRLVNALFELSRLDALQVQPKPEVFSAAELAQDVVMKFKPQAAQHRVELKAVLPQDLPMVYADLGMMDRVLSNLIENALRYTPPQGTVHVGLKSHRQRVQVYVSDTGAGIPEKDLPYLCERFYRVEKSRDRTSGGSGLGLAIAQRILDLHGSALDFESTLNVGTTVSFNLDAGQAG